MRKFDTQVQFLKYKVLRETARLAWKDTLTENLLDLPKIISPGNTPSIRCCIYKERAILGERIKIAMGGDKTNPNVIEVMDIACDECPVGGYVVTDSCRGCLAHRCEDACPRNAITFDDKNHTAHIDKQKCVNCGACAKVCPYTAIANRKRPCENACKIKAISMGENSAAHIDNSKCISCGACVYQCPFGAIVDKSQIFQVVRSIAEGNSVVAIVAPSFVGQFGKDATPRKLKKAMRILGFADTVEVAIGADLCVIEEAADFLEEVPEKHKFMVTSCCPSWSDMVKKLFPQFEKNISVAFTPMVLTARMIKRDHPDCKVVFVGPCDSKKLEARRESVRSDVDFVLTFEEALGIFAAKGMDKAFPPEDEEEMPAYSSRDARRFAYSGGVAQAVVNAIHDMEPDREVKVAAATGLADCRKLLMMAKVGKYDGYLLEGMACPGGCIAGAGTLRPIEQSHKEVEAFSSEAKFTCANDTPYMDYLPLIEEKDKIRKL